ncbi:hypothetical protein NLG97_g9763 [Lecanicillium saksenae]|uniref:Uncharacterized protein n=1 Tax=Lecanicillium saksenae TaxID=468837 RepID=A0ACC1QF37_9HYPO|nr:hypothetical protein NLG97_g9763 [Lecanicillium saksenae]
MTYDELKVWRKSSVGFQHHWSQAAGEGSPPHSGARSTAFRQSHASTSKTQATPTCTTSACASTITTLSLCILSTLTICSSHRCPDSFLLRLPSPPRNFSHLCFFLRRSRSAATQVPIMKVTFRDLKQQKFTLDVEPTDLVSWPHRERGASASPFSAVKEKISGEKGWDPKHQKLIYSGKILKDEETVGSYNIEEKGFVVCMVNKVRLNSTRAFSNPSTQVF